MSVLKEMADLFEKGKLHWTKLGEALLAAKLDGSDFSDLDMDRRKIRSIVSAYQFLEVRRPSFLKDPVYSVTHWTVSRVPAVYAKMKGPSKEEDLETLLDKVLEGKMNAHDLQRLSVKLDPKLAEKRKSLRESRPDTGSRPSQDARLSRWAEWSFASLGHQLDALDSVLDQAIDANGYDKLRKTLAEKSERIAVKLNCIADEDYQREWEKRREFIL